MPLSALLGLSAVVSGRVAVAHCAPNITICPFDRRVSHLLTRACLLGAAAVAETLPTESAPEWKPLYRGTRSGERPRKVSRIF